MWRYVSIPLLACIGFLVAQPVSAQVLDGFTILPEACRACPAAWGCVIDVVNNLVTLALSLAVFIVVVVIAWAGTLLVLTPANPENKSQARKMLINAAVGLVIALAAWLIIDKILAVLGAGGVDRQTSVLSGTGTNCIEVPELQQIEDGGELVVAAKPGTVNLGGGCPGASCTRLTVACEAAGCTVDAGLAGALGTVDSPVGWAVTEAYPPSRTHKAACHKNGTCVDVGLRPKTYTVETVTAFYNAAVKAGLRPVFETKSATLYNDLQNTDIQVLYLPTHISADHFSVYGK